LGLLFTGLVLCHRLHQKQKLLSRPCGNAEVKLSPAGSIAQSEIKAIAGRYKKVAINRYVIMPNHVHMIVVIEGIHIHSPAAGDPIDPPVETGLAPSPREHVSVSQIVGAYKAGVSRICHANGILEFAWQPRFHDHILRSNVSVNAARDYIDHNVENWLLDPDNLDGGAA
jgi:REP element-mobilizing transposase RayT